MNSRRNFLKIAGASLTGSLLKPINSSAAKLSVGKNSVKIGVLPSSNEHPLYPGSYLNGLRLGLNQRNALKKNKIELVTEQVNFGSPKFTATKVQQLITENNVNMIVGLLNSEVAIDFGELVKNAGIPTMIINSGENFLVSQLKSNPYLFFNTLNLFQNAYLAGKHAVEKYGKNINVVTAFYDSGYDALGTFYKGVESAGGGDVITHLKKQNDINFIEQTLNEIEKTQPDGIYIFLNGNLADDFFRAYKLRNLELPLITTSFNVEESRLVNLGNAGLNIENVSTWTKNLSIPKNQKFVSDYKKQYSKEPDQFSFLGYESGLIIYESLANCGSDFSGINLANSIKNCKVNSPGGNISVNPDSGLVVNPVYLCTTKQTVFNLPENIVLKKMNPISEFSSHFDSLDTNLRSGWVNPYLFV